MKTNLRLRNKKCQIIIYWGAGVILFGLIVLSCLVRKPEQKGERYLAIGFDDFRDSDFDMVIPIFNSYGAYATFNRISNGVYLSDDDYLKIRC